MNYKISETDEAKLVDYPHVIMVDSLNHFFAKEYLGDNGYVQNDHYIIISQNKDKFIVYTRGLSMLFCFKSDKILSLFTIWMPVVPENPQNAIATLYRKISKQISIDMANGIIGVPSDAVNPSPSLQQQVDTLRERYGIMTIDYKISEASKILMVKYPHSILIDSLIFDDTIAYLRSISCLKIKDYIIIDQEPDEVSVYDRPLSKLFCFKDDNFIVLLTLWLPVIPPNEVDMLATISNLLAREIKAEIDNEITVMINGKPFRF